MTDSLATLVKLHKMRMDEQRQLLVKLQERLEQVEADITTLELRQATEYLTVQEHPETSLTYGDFVRWAAAQGRELQKQKQATSTAIDLARDRLAELFEEQKRYELAQEARAAEARREEQRRETMAMDEVGSVSFARKQRDK